jgi:uncharacterized protein YjbI with pentapeptide repeats
MANEDHIARLKNGVAAWNAWRDENRNIRPDLSGARLYEANLGHTDLSEADLGEADLSEANLGKANLSGANLRGAHLNDANLRGADLNNADLSGANLIDANSHGVNLKGANLTEAYLIDGDFDSANLSGAMLRKADLSGASLCWANLTRACLIDAYIDSANLSEANLSGADLGGAKLYRVNLGWANLSEANLTGAHLNGATLLETDLRGADLTACRIYGVSAWKLKLEGTQQQNLLITPVDEPAITVDNIEIAQFVYLLLHNEKIREAIDTITSKAVLILGRFTDERKAVLDALREELRKHNYLPILFDFDVPSTRDITETVSLLAGMARFIIADLTDPSSIPKELEAIVPGLAVPVQPLLEGSTGPYAMFKDYWKYEWVLPVHRYEGLERLLATLAKEVIAPAEGKVKALEERRRMIEAELTKPP